MPVPHLTDLLFPLLAFALAAALTPTVAWLARRWGFVARPRSDRWHKKPTALLGGAAIFASVVVIALLAVPLTPHVVIVLTTSSLIFCLGLVDDIRHLKPYQKLIGQLLGAGLVVSCGIGLNWTPWIIVNQFLTMLWLVGITNAINLLDNMDGLAAGICAIAAAFMGICFAQHEQFAEVALMAIVVASLVGFLIFNSNPASIFMGDCGSLFLGFLLASSALLNVPGWRSRSFLPVLVVPVLILFIPIFDTTFVTILRKLAGRAVSQGGRDHTSHRLVALGLSERTAVWMLYGLAGSAGLLAVLVQSLRPDISIPAVIVFSLALILLGIYLAQVKSYSDEEMEQARKKPLVAFLVNISYKRRVFEVLLDIVLIVVAYRAAYYVHYGADQYLERWSSFYDLVPLLVCLKITVFLTLGVYRGLWRYVGMHSLQVYARAVVASSVAALLVIWIAFPDRPLSRTVFALDAIFLFALLSASRFAFRLLRSLLPISAPSGGRRVVIYGAGDGGELLLRELLNNHSYGAQPIGFLDDNPLKQGKSMHGLRVLGGVSSFSELVETHKFEEVILSTSKIDRHRMADLLKKCESMNVCVKRLSIQLETVSEFDLELRFPENEERPAGNKNAEESIARSVPAT
jgi:UDP-GlcNAc:undecaprenyl-phosphate/decaprenyl-phosphate GlcNAc-1-phosphate transferase